MSKRDILSYADFILPASVATKADVSQLVWEAERIDSEMTSSSVRKRFTKDTQEAPAMSDEFSEFLQKNDLEMNDSKFRTQLVKHLRQLKDTVPVVHMTFAVDADPESLQQIIAWLRSSAHPQTVIEVGLQPALVAGVYLRTTNHVQDFSLRGKLKGSRDILKKELEALRVGK